MKGGVQSNEEGNAVGEEDDRPRPRRRPDGMYFVEQWTQGSSSRLASGERAGYGPRGGPPPAPLVLFARRPMVAAPLARPPTAEYVARAKARGGLPTTQARALPAVPLALLAAPALLVLLKLLLLLLPLFILYFQASFGELCVDTRTPMADSHRAPWFSGKRCLPGWEGPCCDIQEGYSDGEFVLRRIRNDEVEYELPFSGPRSIDNTSAPPDEMLGLWWLDQRLVHTDGMSEHEGYAEGEAKAVTAAEELVVSFSEGVWHPASRCVKPVPTYGGHRGHWTWFDVDGEGHNAGAGSGLRGNYEFCYQDDNTIKINMRYRLFGAVWVVVPDFFTTLTMERRNFGLTRVTRVGPDQLRRLQADWTWFFLLPIPVHVVLRIIGLMAPVSQPLYNYPMYRIVDTYGRRTRHYDAYLRFANAPTNETEANQLSAPRNRGRGTSLVGVPIEYCRARNETCTPASESPAPGTLSAIVERGQCF
eukprot:scaffold25193_cov29-Tisochrysis_lutea.AAC.1